MGYRRNTTANDDEETGSDTKGIICVRSGAWPGVSWTNSAGIYIVFYLYRCSSLTSFGLPFGNLIESDLKASYMTPLDCVSLT